LLEAVDLAIENPEAKKKAIILIGILVALVILVAFLLGGFQGFIGLIKTIIIIGFVVAFIGFIVYVVWWIFIRKHKKDIPYANLKNYIQSAISNGKDYMDGLILTGDKKHSPKTFMKIKGYLRTRLFNGEERDMFVGKKNPLNPFEEWKVVMISPDDHSDLIGDVYIDGFSLIKRWGYYWLHTDLMETEKIDKQVTFDAYRTLLYDTLGDFKGIVDRSMGLDIEFSREMKKEKVLKIPVLSGQEGG
jgi:hypothetical protein